MYDTDTDESTGTWDDWEQSSGCSRTCGGGILIGKSVKCSMYFKILINGIFFLRSGVRSQIQAFSYQY